MNGRPGVRRFQPFPAGLADRRGHRRLGAKRARSSNDANHETFVGRPAKLGRPHSRKRKKLGPGEKASIPRRKKGAAWEWGWQAWEEPHPGTLVHPREHGPWIKGSSRVKKSKVVLYGGKNKVKETSFV